MKINKIISQCRRDFLALYECEHCGYTTQASGYDDEFFHAQVIPGMKCYKCGKKAPEDYRPLATKYKDHESV